MSPDARGHGGTVVQDPQSAGHDVAPDLSLNTLGEDLAFVVQETQKSMGWATSPDVLLIGHSLGGAVVTDVAHKRLLGPAVLGYSVLDVVEGPSETPSNTSLDYSG